MRDRLTTAVAGGTALGLVGSALGLASDPRRTLLAWLTSFAFLLTTCVGCLALVMIFHAARARWVVALRRAAEAPMALLPVFLVLVLPVLLGAGRLYPWMHAPDLPAEEQHAVEHAHAWLNLPFFAVRSYVWLLIWCALAVLLARLSLRQDDSFEESRQIRMQRLSAAGLPVLGLTFTFASLDWFMSLEPGWQSSVYGLYVCAGALVSGMALVSLAASVGLARGRLPPGVGPQHLHAAGKLLFALVCFWGWMAFAQLIVIWEGNVPREVGFYRARVEEGWGPVTFVLVAAQFAIPFLVLLSREVKRRPGSLGFMAAWLLAAHYLDVYWLLVPAGARRFGVHWVDAATLLLAAGILGIAVLLLARRASAFPRGDAYYPQALRYRGS